MKIKLLQSVCMLVIAVLMVTAMSSLVVLADDDSSFEMDIITRPNAAEISDPIVYPAIPGQICVFLVDVYNLTGIDSVKISAKADGGMYNDLTVYPETITESQVAEISIIPKRSTIGQTVALEITGKMSGVSVTETIYIEVINDFDLIRGFAEDAKDIFVPWIAENYPELNIDENTVFEPTVVRHGLIIVEHYMFLSDEWEMYVTWHCTAYPDDWSKVYLRQRYVETAPSYAFKEYSMTYPTEPYVIDVPLDI
ncbi:MAG: hypothetical protein KAJ33_01480 [Thermoplasmata archaeon]|nr:hypothetical protein [Thermoplasmata archaeon]